MTTVTLEITFVGLMLFVEDKKDGKLHVLLPTTADTTGHAGHAGHGGSVVMQHRATLLAEGITPPMALDGYRVDFSGEKPPQLTPGMDPTGAIPLGLFSVPEVTAVERKFLKHSAHPELTAHIILEGGELIASTYDIFLPVNSPKPLLAPNVVKWSRTIEAGARWHLPDLVPMDGVGAPVKGAEKDSTGAPLGGASRTISMLVCNIDASKPRPASIKDLLSAPTEPFDAGHMFAFGPLFGGNITFSGRGIAIGFEVPLAAPSGAALPLARVASNALLNVGLFCHPRVCAVLWMPAGL